MDFTHLPLQKRKQLFMIIVGIAGFFSLLLWFVMLEGHIHALSTTNVVDEVLNRNASTTTPPHDLTPSLGSIVSSWGASMWDMTAQVPSLFHSHDIEINNGDH